MKSKYELPWPSDYELQLTQEVTGSNPGKDYWWMTGRASGPKMLTASAKVPTSKLGTILAP